jgi:hypothetical protein
LQRSVSEDGSISAKCSCWVDQADRRGTNGTSPFGGVASGAKMAANEIVRGGTCAATDVKALRTQATADMPELALVGTAEIVFRICEAIW